MITIIMLTAIALIMLLIGFFEIRIPFIHEKAFSSKGNRISKSLKKQNKSAKMQVRTIKNLLKGTKNEVGYRLIQHHKTSDIA